MTKIMSNFSHVKLSRTSYFVIHEWPRLVLPNCSFFSFCGPESDKKNDDSFWSTTYLEVVKKYCVVFS